MTIEAVEPELPNHWVRPVAFFMLLTIISVSVAGWILSDKQVAFKIIMSVLTVMADLWSFNASAQWGRAMKRERVKGERAYWFLTTLFCSVCSLASVYHALNVLMGDFGGVWAAYAGMTALAIMVPFANWAIEGVERAPPKRELEPSASSEPERSLVDQLAEQVLSAQKARPAARKPAQRSPKRAGGGWAPKLIQGGALAALIAQMSLRPSDPEAFERAVLAKHEHPSMSQEEIAARAGVPRSTIGRWMRDAPEVFAVHTAAA